MILKILRLITISALLFFAWSCEDEKADDTTPPTVEITYPVQDSNVSGQVVIVADANDNEVVDKVEFYVDGQLKGTDTESPWEYLWDTSPVADGNQHSLYAKAHDEAGNTASSSMVLVTVSGPVTDIDGNIYQTITIGTQTWMAENLKVTHYRNGDPIITDWTSYSGAYGVYNNNANNEVETYGNLYDWYAVNDSRNIAPEGWHVPTDEDWKELEISLGMSQSEADSIEWHGTDEGSKLAGNADLWLDGTLKNNAKFGISGFTALPGGYRSDEGDYLGLGSHGYFWSSTWFGDHWALFRTLYYNLSNIRRYHDGKDIWFSVRCLRD